MRGAGRSADPSLAEAEIDAVHPPRRRAREGGGRLRSGVFLVIGIMAGAAVFFAPDPASVPWERIVELLPARHRDGMGPHLRALQTYKAAYDRLAVLLEHAPAGPGAAALREEQADVLRQMREEARLINEPLPPDLAKLLAAPGPPSAGASLPVQPVPAWPPPPLSSPDIAAAPAAPQSGTGFPANVQPGNWPAEDGPPGPAGPSLRRGLGEDFGAARAGGIGRLRDGSDRPRRDFDVNPANALPLFPPPQGR